MITGLDRTINSSPRLRGEIIMTAWLHPEPPTSTSPASVSQPLDFHKFSLFSNGTGNTSLASGRNPLLAITSQWPAYRMAEFDKPEAALWALLYKRPSFQSPKDQRDDFPLLIQGRLARRRSRARYHGRSRRDGVDPA